MFLHDAILEGISSGNTEVPVDLLAQRMKELDEVDAEGENGYSKEFSVSLYCCMYSVFETVNDLPG